MCNLSLLAISCPLEDGIGISNEDGYESHFAESINACTIKCFNRKETDSSIKSMMYFVQTSGAKSCWCLKGVKRLPSLPPQIESATSCVYS